MGASLDKISHGSSSSRNKGSSSQTQGKPASGAKPGGFFAIPDNFNRIEDVQTALRKEGLESSNLILAVDYTKSNEWTGKYSSGGKSLHHLSHVPNPYQGAMSIIAKTLETFDDDNLIPVYGFGDTTTGDRRVFSFNSGDQPCQGLDHVLQRYQELTPSIKLAGPTSFAPAIRQAMKIVADSGNQYHILILIADGQVTRPSDMPKGRMSEQERDTTNAIVAASNMPLSIVMIGVGDGPWDVMEEFDDMLPQRSFDNFQFVCFTDIMKTCRSAADMPKTEALFALRALMEIPEQYKIIQRLGFLGRSGVNIGQSPRPLDPPLPRSSASQLGQGGAMPSFGPSASFGQTAFPAPPQYPGGGSTSASGVPASSTGTASKGEPQLYLCPITQDLMVDPVIAADGYSYERSAIEKWLATHNTSPLSNQPLPHKNLTTNNALRSTIMEYKNGDNEIRSAAVTREDVSDEEVKVHHHGGAGDL
eukprot:CAMPEP_0119106372 /NCGR_PEP_ID=MMETSP1180-20130426/4076_1 /TAXON_ID=3052 ORGANISM="Chlamydomonas cf sp, Strain CCMP681" /NCGR_SAMPLE_ID=MMETSP1180 /ASSEMBLY_ACC=CAM_ASM_000741 /LENGTH=475 /DNA_ID=CAMNT_0007091691 /DNA_START=54 /DNA_END=1482 /DNA_ORIENTATION=-